MHARHRNGYRSNPVGIGGLPYRNYNNRGVFGRGHQKIFQSGPPPPPPPPRRGGDDVFMEAGRLATQYLISKGLLPANLLYVKCQNGNSRNHFDYVPAVRRFPQDYGHPPDGMTERARLESFKNLEIERSGPSSAKVMISSEKQGEDDVFSGSVEKPQPGEEQQSVFRDLESKSCLEAASEKKQTDLHDDNVGLKAPSSDVSPEGGVESAERSDGSNSKDLHMDTEEVMMDDDNNGESKNPTVKEDVPMENNGSDLLTFIRFHKVPTRTRSSMAIRGAKVDPVLNDDDESHNSGESRVPWQHASTDKGQESNIREAPCEHRGEKRPLCLIDTGEGAKKTRDGSPSNVQEGLHLSISKEEDQQSSNEQPFPDSFKICDLNDNHGANSALTFQRVEEGSNRSDVEDNKGFNNSERMDEAIFTDLESFPDSMQRVNEMPQDGYGLMISELLEADIPDCPGADRIDEAILDDDDSIYMSLGEIPISFVPVWDQQPTRGYDKPY